MKPWLPHSVFVILASLLYLGARALEARNSGRDFIRIDGLILYMYGVGLLSYVVAVTLIALMVKRTKGEWRWGGSYLLALLLAPIFFFVFAQTLGVLSEIFGW